MHGGAGRSNKCSVTGARTAVKLAVQFSNFHRCGAFRDSSSVAPVYAIRNRRTFSMHSFLSGSCCSSVAMRQSAGRSNLQLEPRAGVPNSVARLSDDQCVCERNFINRAFACECHGRGATEERERRRRSGRHRATAEHPRGK